MCREDKPVSSFYADKVCGERQYHCKSCHREYQRAWRRRPEYRAKKLGRKYRMKHLYNLTEAQFEAMEAAQGGKCAVCKTATGTKGKDKLVVDHCHDTGAVRGLLCDTCNRALGFFRDSTETLQSAIDYINSSRRG